MTSTSSWATRQATVRDTALYLIDTSGLFRILQGTFRDAWDQLAAGVVALCPIVELEFLHSWLSLADRLDKQRLMRQLLEWVPVHDGAYERAKHVQQLLTEKGQHRSAGAVDLLIAATAEQERLTVLCDDRDYLAIAAVTGQPVRLVTDSSAGAPAVTGGCDDHVRVD